MCASDSKYVIVSSHTKGQHRILSIKFGVKLSKGPRPQYTDLPNMGATIVNLLLYVLLSNRTKH